MLKWFMTAAKTPAWIYATAGTALLAVGAYIYILRHDNAVLNDSVTAQASAYAQLGERHAAALQANRDQNATIATMREEHTATVAALTAKYDHDLRTMRRANQILQRSVDAANTEKDGPVADITVDTLYDIDRMLREE